VRLWRRSSQRTRLPDVYLRLQDMHGAGAGEAYKRQLAAADSSAVYTIVDNKLGVPAQLELDFGDHL
jgi:hypothetical protein